MNIHSNWTDAQRRIQAMYHMEVCFETGVRERDKPLNEIYIHLWAAHYLVQSIGSGGIGVPENYDEVMRDAMELDAKDECADVIHRVKGSPPA